MNSWSQDLLDRFKKEAEDIICVAAMPLKQISQEPVLLRFFASTDDVLDLDALKAYILDALRYFQKNNRNEQSIAVNFSQGFIEFLIVYQDLIFIFIAKKARCNEVLLSKYCHDFCQQLAPTLQKAKQNSLHEFKTHIPLPTAEDKPLVEAKINTMILRQQPGVYVTRQIGKQDLIQHWLEKQSLGTYAKQNSLQARQQALAEVGSHFVSAHFKFEGKHLKIERAYIKGRNMVEIVESRQKMTLAQGMAILRKLIDILAPVHAKKLAHGNIHPENVFFSPNREVLLTDDHLFELIASDNFIRKSYSNVDRLPVGRLGYLAPEQLLGEAATPQSDFWALGYLLCYLLLGEPVLDFNTPSEQIVASHHSIKEAIKTRVVVIYPNLKALLSGLVHEKPEARFESLDVILKQIMQIMQAQQT